MSLKRRQKISPAGRYLQGVMPVVIRISAGGRVFDGDRYQRQRRTLPVGDFPGERNFVLCRQVQLRQADKQKKYMYKDFHFNP